MTKIHGLAYLILGLLIGGFSYYINNKNKSNAFALFFYIGIIFVMIGIIKLLAKVVQKKAVKKTEIHNHAHQRPTPTSQVRFCGHCGASLRQHDHFCPMCGNAAYSLR